MIRRGKTWFALLSAVTAFAISAFGEPQDIQVIQVPILTEARIQFFRLPWPSTRFVTRKVLEDNQGFLWLGAADGLRRYDGYGFLRVPGDSEGRNASGFITSESLIKDRSGVLWFGVEDFLDRYNPATGEFKRYRTFGEGTCGSYGLHQISEDREGLLWLATNESLMRLDPVTARLDCYSHREDDDATIASNLVISTIESRDGTLWVATSEALEAFDRRTGKVMRRISFETGSGAHWSLAAFPANLYEDRSGVIWTGLSSGADLAAVDPKTGRITVYTFRAPESQKIAPSGILSILEDQDGAMWLGLLKLEPDRKRVVWYESNPDDPNGLSGDLVVGLFRDREGSIWANTKAGDVYRFDPRSPTFRSYRHQPLNQNSLIDDSVISAYEDRRGFLWVGTEHGLNRTDRRTGEVKRYVGGDFAVGVRSIAEDRGGYLWFGTRGNGLMRFDPRTSASRTYSYSKFDPKSLSNNYVGALLVDRNGTLWAATDYGINRYDEKTGQFQWFSPTGKSLTRYHSIAEEQAAHYGWQARSSTWIVSIPAQASLPSTVTIRTTTAASAIFAFIRCMPTMPAQSGPPRSAAWTNSTPRIAASPIMMLATDCRPTRCWASWTTRTATFGSALPTGFLVSIRERQRAGLTMPRMGCPRICSVCSRLPRKVPAARCSLDHIADWWLSSRSR